MIRGPWATRAAGLALLAALGACARQGAPTGGPQDRRPPLVVSVEPDTFAVVEPGLDRLKVEFNERISERSSTGDLASAVLISPEIPDLEVKHNRSGLEIRIPGGLQADRVYTIRILPEIQDMFGNPMAVPFEWAISTGGRFTVNAVVGQVWDRATGGFLEGVRVVLTPEGVDPDAPPLDYAVRSGNEGLYALRVLPVGAFRVTAFQDSNSDRILDAMEPVGTARDSLGPADTVFLSIPVLMPDTTAAVLAQTEVLDSTVVRLQFDDYLDPTVSLDGVTVGLEPDTVSSAEADSPVAGGPAVAEELPGPARLFHEFQWTQFRDSLQATRDSLLGLEVERARAVGDSARADSLAAAGIEPLPGGPAGPGQGGPPGQTLPDGTPVPQPSLVLLLDGPLPSGVPVRIVLTGVVNLNRLEDGGGAVTALWAPPAPDSVPADTLAAVGDSAAVPDTGRVVLFPRP